MIIDTHAHLNTKDFDHDLEQVLRRAKDSDVQHILVIGMDHASSELAIKMAEAHDMLYATVGLHPGYVDDDHPDFVEHLLNHPKVVAIGECGLDYYWTKDNQELQMTYFKRQIELAVKTKLPLVIHTRNSFLEAYQMLLPFKGLVTGVFHCFSSTFEDAMKAIDLGFYIGIDGPITYKNNQELIKIVTGIDLNYLLVETDSPYLTPVPYRGKRNEPAFTKEVVQAIAQYTHKSFEDISKMTSDNAYRLFKLGGK